MLSREQMIDFLVDDAADTCSNDPQYLRSLLRAYFTDMTEEEIKKAYHDAFDYGEE